MQTVFSYLNQTKLDMTKMYVNNMNILKLSNILSKNPCSKYKITREFRKMFR